jgi:hypothetical protein
MTAPHDPRELLGGYGFLASYPLPTSLPAGREGKSGINDR